MTLNSRNKGANGEREVVRLMNEIIAKVLAADEWDDVVKATALGCIQRNQAQSAVGGHDLNGVFGMSVEIKRVENLQIEKWWQQCVSQSERNGEHPVLLYRQNHQPWRCLTLGHAPLPGGRLSSMRVQMEEAAFMVWFHQWVYYKMRSGDLPRL